jgi:2-polyprenyl-3-methyl-5-hydroxy-6-metoxy-1,4-benzoquinol methylase
MLLSPVKAALKWVSVTVGRVGSCCTPSVYGRFFGRKLARRDARRYRRKGLDDTGRWLADQAIAQGIEGGTVLEAGGGVGAIQLELLRAGAARTTNVELSPEYEEAATTLARELGLEGRSERRIGDFVHEDVGEADVVVLHRVVCCYPDYEALLGAAAQRARRVLVFSHPPGHALARVAVRGVNLVLALIRQQFRSYVHPPDAMRAVVERAGFRVVGERRGKIWRAVALIPAPAPAKPAPPLVAPAPAPAKPAPTLSGPAPASLRRPGGSAEPTPLRAS